MQTSLSICCQWRLLCGYHSNIPVDARKQGGIIKVKHDSLKKKFRGLLHVILSMASAKQKLLSSGVIIFIVDSKYYIKDTCSQNI